MMKIRALSVLLALLSSNPVSAQSLERAQAVYPLKSPLEIVRTEINADGEPTQSVQVEYGIPMRVNKADPNYLEIELPDGEIIAVHPSSVIAATHMRKITAGDGYFITDRVMLPFWDSMLRAETYLLNGPASGSSPIAREAAINESFEQLVATDVVTIETGLGPQATFARSLVPFSVEPLLDRGSDRDLQLHIVADASQYARSFTEERLSQLSRLLGNDPRMSGSRVMRTIFFEGGRVSGPSAITISELRRILPTDAPVTAAGRSLPESALTAVELGIQQIKAEAADTSIHVLLILLGSGISAQELDPEAMNRISRSLESIAGSHQVGVIAAAATPEPSETPSRIISALKTTSPQRQIGFNDNIFPVVAAMVEELKSQVAPAYDGMSVCGLDQTVSFPCLSINDSVLLSSLRHQQGLDWVAMPLWHAVDGDILKVSDEPANAMDQKLAAVDSDVIDPELYLDLERRAAELGNTVEGLRSDLSAEQEERRVAEDRVEELVKNIALLEAIRLELVDEASRLEGVHRGTLEELSAARRTILASDARMSALEVWARKSRSMLDETSESLRREKEAVEALKGERTALQEALDESTSRMRLVGEERDAAQRSVAVLDDQMRDRERQLRSLANQLARANTRYGALMLEMEDIEGVRATQASLIRRLEDDLRTTSISMNNLARERREMAERIEYLELSRDELEDTVEGLDAANRNLEAGHASLEERLAAADIERADLAERLASSQADLNARRQAHDEETRRLLERLEGAEAQLSEKEGQLQDQLGLALALEKRLEALRSASASDTPEKTVPADLVAEIEERLEKALADANALRAARARSVMEQQALSEELNAVRRGYGKTLAAVTAERDRLAARVASIEENLAQVSRVVAKETNGDEQLPAGTGDDISVFNDAVLALVQKLASSQEALEVERSQAQRQIQSLEDDLGQEARRTVELERELDTMAAENSELRSKVMVAREVADEKLELVGIMQDAESAWVQRERALQEQIVALQQELDSQVGAVEGIVTASLPPAGPTRLGSGAVRPNSRPSDLGHPARKRDNPLPEAREAQVSEQASRPVVQQRSQSQSARSESVRAPQALPGSLFVRSPQQARSASTLSDGGGFFGN